MANIVEQKKNQEISAFRNMLFSEGFTKKLQNTFGNEKMLNSFRNSMIELYSESYSSLKGYDQMLVAQEAYKAASLDLPLSRSLGCAYVAVFAQKPTFVIGYKGLIQLAQRTGYYKFINADIVYEGELISKNKLTGEIVLDEDKRTSDKIIGYFAYIETVYGFKKALFWTKDKAIEHGKKSPSWSNAKMPWQTHFDAMAIKSVLRHLIDKYGIKTTELAVALKADGDDIHRESEENANTEDIDIIDNETGEIIDGEVVKDETDETPQDTGNKKPEWA